MDSTNRASSRGLASVLSSMPSWARQARQVVSCTAEIILVRVKRDWPQIAKDLKPVCTAISEAVTINALAEFSPKWETLSGYYLPLGEHLGRIRAVPAVRP
jgi:hypothetical protein